MFGFSFIVEAKYALFTRPDLKVERFSYDVPTPSALTGMIGSVYWHPGVKYVIDKIYVYNEIKHTTIRVNEVTEKLNLSAVERKMKELEKKQKSESNNLHIFTNDVRTQRSNTILCNVKYGIKAHFEIIEKLRNELRDYSKDVEPEGKVKGKLIERLKKGKNFNQPYLGCREFPANIYFEEDLDSVESYYKNKKEIDLGVMLYDLQFNDLIKEHHNECIFKDEAKARFYHPKMENGIIDVKKYAEKANLL